MTSPVSDFELKGLFAGLIKQAIIWAPIVVGVVHQILMYLFNIDSIYVFLTPPGYISPFVSLEAAWWLVLTLGTSLLCLLVYINRIRPRRVIYPLYLYLIFLLIWVKPV
jgi:hypothetical protein